MLTGFDLCRAALAVTDISAPEQSVLMVLAIMANDQAQCWPAINGAAGLTGKTKLSERAVQRAIQRLKDLGHIARKQQRHGCVYTVHPVLTPVTETGVSLTGDSGTPVSETPDTQAPRGDCVAPKQPRTTIPKKASPSRKVRASAPAFVPPSEIPETEWNAFEEMRRRIKKPMTDHARGEAVARLRKLAEDGYPPGEVLNHSILNNYQGLFPPKDSRNGHHRSDHNRPRSTGLLGAVFDAERDDRARQGV